MIIKQKKHMFSEADATRIFNFLSRFVYEANTVKMGKKQALIVLPHGLENHAESEFRANISRGSRYGVITFLQDVFQYMLRNYETPTSMPEALESRPVMRYRAKEPKQFCKKRLNATLLRTCPH